MNIDKVSVKKNIELLCFIFVYIILFSNAIITHDNPIALISAFCGISYTILAGKGIPSCYLIGVTGSALYAYLAFQSALWGNLVLYAAYYVPMQILGFFKWNKNLKENKKEIIKISLTKKESIILYLLTLIISFIAIFILFKLGDTSPFIDGITTIFSLLGMYLTVRRCLQQWVVWMIVNGLSLIMWIKVVINGTTAYSTVIMWLVYFLLAIYFYFVWKKEVKNKTN